MRAQVLFGLILFGVVFGGCFQQEPEPQPTWLLSPPKNTADRLYGAAAGDSLAAAKSNALGMIAADLFITVQSDMKLTSHSLMRNDSEQTLEEFLSNTRAKTKAMQFSNVEVVKQQEFDEAQVAVMVSIDRNALYRDQKAQLDGEIDSMQTLLGSASGSSAFVRLGLLRKATEKGADILAQSALLKVINARADTQAYSDYVRDVNKQYGDLKYATKVRIISDASAVYFVEPLGSALNAEGISVVRTGSKPLTVELSGDVKRDKLYGFFIEKLQLNIVTKDGSRTVASSKRVFSGKSRYDFDSARRQAADSFREALRAEGVFTLMGVL